MQKEEKNTRRIGAYYEEQAAQYLQSKGYSIIKRNYKTPYGEIDLIAKKPDLLVFCEVKFRSSDRYGTGLEAVTVKKQQRIIKSARYFCNWYCGSKEFAYRFDVIAIEPQEKICHIENAFEL